MKSLILATRNEHKIGEIRLMLGATVRCLGLSGFKDVPSVVEDRSTFAGNATKKAVEHAYWLGSQHSILARLGEARELFVVADDSGLEVDALNGQPGVHSARFAALDRNHPGNSSDAENNAKLLRLLKEVPQDRRSARFRCVIAVVPLPVQLKANPNPPSHVNALEERVQLFEGVCEGWIDLGPRGTGGFGYDPLFVPRNFHYSFAELSEEEKNVFSHRGAAVQKLKSWLAQVSSPAPR